MFSTFFYVKEIDWVVPFRKHIRDLKSGKKKEKEKLHIGTKIKFLPKEKEWEKLDCHSSILAK